jgi:hypothetical protein
VEGKEEEGKSRPMEGKEEPVTYVSFKGDGYHHGNGQVSFYIFK